MRLAVSNIAWPVEADETVAVLLAENGVAGIELAPTKIWAEPLEASAADVRACRRLWERRGLPVVALQALLYGRPDLTIFDGVSTRRKTGDYLKGMIALASRLGASALVFGSPKNRQRGPLSLIEAEEIAVEFFADLGRAAAQAGVAFCLEPNPQEYGCDYIVNAQEGQALIERVGQPGFALHLDTAAMHLAGDSVPETLKNASQRCRHFHVSEPYLAPIGTAGVNHVLVAGELWSSAYEGWISIEMKQSAAPGQWLSDLRDSIRHVVTVYGDGSARERSKPLAS